MKYTTIRIEGAILSADILDRIEQGDITGQLSRDFGFDPRIKVKDEIARAWADAQDLWRIFNRRREKVAGQGYGTTETRNFWMVPLLGLFGYEPSLQRPGPSTTSRMPSATMRPTWTDFRCISSASTTASIANGKKAAAECRPMQCCGNM